jgi:hypothetical protein
MVGSFLYSIPVMEFLLVRILCKRIYARVNKYKNIEEISLLNIYIYIYIYTQQQTHHTCKLKTVIYWLNDNIYIYIFFFSKYWLKERLLMLYVEKGKQKSL